MRKESALPDQPWQRNRMLWLVIAIPTLTVAGCLLTVFLALANPDQLVSDYSVRQDYSLVADQP